MPKLFLGEWTRKQKAGEITKAEEPKVYHHGQVYGTKDLKGDKALVRKYKTKGGEMKKPPKEKEAKREMASDLIREHMHHLGRHSGGPDQAIAIGLRQAGLAKKSVTDPDLAHHIGMAEHHQNVIRQCINAGGQTDRSMMNLKALAAHLRAIRTSGTHRFEEDSARAKRLSADIEMRGTKPLEKARISKEFLADLTEEERKLFHNMRYEEIAKRTAARQGKEAATPPKGEDRPPETPKPAEPLFPKEAPKEGTRVPVERKVVKPEPDLPSRTATAGGSRAATPSPEVLRAQKERDEYKKRQVSGGRVGSDLGKPTRGPKPLTYRPFAALKEGEKEEKSIPETPKPAGYKPLADVRESHKRANEALQKLQTHMTSTAEKWKQEDEEIGKQRAGLLRRSLETLVAKGHRGFYHKAKANLKRRGGADTPRDVQEAVGGKGHAGFYRKKAPKRERAMMGKGIDVIAEQQRAKTRAAHKALPVAAAVAGKVLGGAASTLGSAASTLGSAASGVASQPSSSSQPEVNKGTSACKGCGKAMGLCKCAMKSKTAQATDILKGRMKLVTDPKTGQMSPQPVEHAPVMSMEKIESGPSAGQHRLVGPSHFEGGGSSKDKEGPEVISSSPRMHIPSSTPLGARLQPSSGDTKEALGELKKIGAPKPGQWGSTPKSPVEKPKTPTEAALGELKEMRQPKTAMAAAKSILDKAVFEMTSNPQHGEPALAPRGEKPEVHHALAAAFHERRRDAAPAGTSEWERHNTLANRHGKKLAGVVGSPKAARVAIKQAHGTLLDQGSKAIKDRHVSPGGGGTHSISEEVLREHEPAWAQRSASGIRGKLMASVTGQIDKSLAWLLSKGGVACPDCGKSISRADVKRCPHCNTELSHKITSKLNPRWGFRSAGVEKSEAEIKSVGQEKVSELIQLVRQRPSYGKDDPTPATPVVREPKTGASPGQHILGGMIREQKQKIKEQGVEKGDKAGRKIDDVQERVIEKSLGNKPHKYSLPPHDKNIVVRRNTSGINSGRRFKFEENEEHFFPHDGWPDHIKSGLYHHSFKKDHVVQVHRPVRGDDTGTFKIHHVPAKGKPSTERMPYFKWIEGGHHVGAPLSAAETQEFHHRMGQSDEKVKKSSGQEDKMNKAMSAASVPRMPRALAMQMDAWRNATNVMTRTNSRFSDGINTAAELPDPTATIPNGMLDSNPTVCKGCGRSYMHKSFPAGCPTCTSRKEVPGAWDFVSKAGVVNQPPELEKFGKETKWGPAQGPLSKVDPVKRTSIARTGSYGGTSSMEPKARGIKPVVAAQAGAKISPERAATAAPAKIGSASEVTGGAPWSAAPKSESPLGAGAAEGKLKFKSPAQRTYGINRSITKAAKPAKDEFFRHNPKKVVRTPRNPEGIPKEQCSRCKTWIRGDKMSTLPDGAMVCKDCD